MTDRADDSRGYDWSREEHDRRQAMLGLELTPAQRLAWLERAMDELARLVGRASNPVVGEGDDQPFSE